MDNPEPAAEQLPSVMGMFPPGAAVPSEMAAAAPVPAFEPPAQGAAPVPFAAAEQPIKEPASGNLHSGNEGHLSGQAANPLALRHERLTGTISKYVPTSGWGFVRSHLFDDELGFKTESVMLECQSYEFQEGEAVEFDVQSDERGRPRAVALKPMTGKKPSECLGQRHRGYVRRCADRWGFLNAAAFDGDLFVHRDNLLLGPEQLQEGQPPLRTGQAVEFDVALDDRGRTVAKQITTSALLRPCDWIGRRLHGYIRSFQGAWGFINSDRFAGDLFLHSDSLLPQYQGVELTVGSMVEFDVERDHHKKGGKNRLVARQVGVVHIQPAATYAMPPHHMMQPGYPPDPMVYSTVPPVNHGGMPAPYGTSMNPQAATFAPLQTSPMYQDQMFCSRGYYPGPQPAGVLSPHDQQQLAGLGYRQPPYPYPDAQYAQYPQPGVPPQHMMHPPAPIPPQYMQQMAQPYAPMPGQPQPQPQHPQPQQPLPGQLPMPGQPQMGQPGQYPHQMMAQPQQYGLGSDGQIAATGGVQQVMPRQPDPARGLPATQLPQETPQCAAPQAAAAGGGGEAAAGASEQPQVLLHITTHDWEPDQSGQLRVRKGTLVNVSHRAAHGWVYAATVQPGGEAGEPPAEGWVPQAVAKRVSLCRVAVEWPAEGNGTLSLLKGDLIAVSKEAERGWVYGERISPRRPDFPSDGWLPKKVLEYILM